MDKIYPREKLKKKVFKEIFFGKVSEKYRIWLAFKGMFPELSAIIEKLKQENQPVYVGAGGVLSTTADQRSAGTKASAWSSKKQPKPHSAYAVRLQNLEAKAIIEGVLQEAVEKNIPVLTVHDSVICRIKDAVTVERMMNNHVLRIVGDTPRLKTTIPMAA